MSRNTVVAAAAFMLIGAILACNVPFGQTSSQPDFVATITAQAQALAQAGGTPASTQVAGQTSAAVTANVTATTNCRSGPGTAYNIVTSLNAGQMVTVVGQDTADNYWIVDLPTGSGTCWLWGQYATITGDASKLPQMSRSVAAAPKATKTPKPTAQATNTAQASGAVALPPTNVVVGKNFCDLSKTSLGTYNYQINFYITWEPPADPSLLGYYIYRDRQLLVTLGAGDIKYDDDITLTGISAASLPTVKHVYGVQAFNKYGGSKVVDGIASCQ